VIDGRGERPLALSLAVAILLVMPGALAGGFPGPTGSLFDRLFYAPEANGGRVRPPFPIDALADVLERYAGGIGARPQVKAVLIPFGRSLQRDAPRPDYLANPRLLLAVDSGAPPAAGQVGYWLKDRLFVAYQPAASTLEVISYQPERARFEFEVVDDYRAGAVPRVRAGSRSLCLACHQNAAPIFPLDIWNETHANPRLRMALAGASGRWYRRWLRAGMRNAGAMDNATDRANLLPIYDRVWENICRAETEKASIDCRAAAFSAMLRYRLGPFGQLRPVQPTYAAAFIPVARRAWSEAWPGGLPIPDPDLPDRDPLNSATPWIASPGLDPLLPRKPKRHWDATAGPSRVLVGLAESLPDVELARIEGAIGAARRQNAVPPVHLRGPCRAERRPRHFRCRLTETETNAGARLAGEAFPRSLTLRYATRTPGAAPPRLAGAARAEARLLAIEAYEGSRFLSIDMAPPPPSPTTQMGTDPDVTPTQKRRGLRLWLRDGYWVSRVRLPAGTAPRSAEAELRSGQATLEAALALMRTEAGDDPRHPLRVARFQPLRLLAALAHALGLRPTRWCCAPPASAERHRPLHRPTKTVRSPTAKRSPWDRYCSGCHDQPGAHPPPFLRGSRADRRMRMAACAGAIRSRLALWRLPAATRPVSPMPPYRALRSKGIEPESWPRHPDFRRLERLAASLPAPTEGGSCTGNRFARQR